MVIAKGSKRTHLKYNTYIYINVYTIVRYYRYIFVYVFCTIVRYYRYEMVRVYAQSDSITSSLTKKKAVHHLRGAISLKTKIPATFIFFIPLLVSTR